jgi:hypothetical protein
MNKKSKYPLCKPPLGVGGRINIEIKNKPYSIPNSWEALTAEQFVHLSGLLRLYAAGRMSMSDVRLRYVIFVLDIDMRYIPKKHKDTIAQNLYLLQSKVTFIFSIKYPPTIWNNLSPELRLIACKTEPADLPDSPEARILRRAEYTYELDACFAAQLLPEIGPPNPPKGGLSLPHGEVGGAGGGAFLGYTVNTSCGLLSVSLSARQYVDASECLLGIPKNPGLMPLLAAILYCPGTYSPEWAHDNAALFGSVDPATLEAVALNFQALVLLLFTKTHFSILWQKGNDTPDSKLTVGLKEGIYALSEDGYGDIAKVGNMPLTEYLEILRKKKIDAVRTLHSYDTKVTDIAKKTGLDVKTINDII